MKTKVAALLVPLLIGALPLVAAPAYAATCGGQQTAILSCHDTKNGSAIIDLLIVGVNFLALGVGLAVLAGIVWGAFLYASADTNAEQAKRGISHVRNAVIALVIFIFMYAIINYLVPGGLL